MIQEREVRERLASVILGKLSLAAFGEWLASESWNMFADSSNEAVALVAAINIRVDAYDGDALDAASLRNELSALLNNVVVSRPVEVAREQQSYFEYIRMASLVPKGQASGLVAA